jgi:hypothetical protein
VRRAVGACLAAVALAGCGPGGGSDAEKSARHLWDYVRQQAQRVSTGSRARRALARNHVCAALTQELDGKLARRYGGDATLPACEFVARVPALNGTTPLGDLRDLRVFQNRGVPQVTARYRLGTGAASRVERVEMTEVNPHHWLITGFLGERGGHD